MSGLVPCGDTGEDPDLTWHGAGSVPGLPTACGSNTPNCVPVPTVEPDLLCDTTVASGDVTDETDLTCVAVRGT